jgi:hypothetical protein
VGPVSNPSEIQTPGEIVFYAPEVRDSVADSTSEPSLSQCLLQLFLFDNQRWYFQSEHHASLVLAQRGCRQKVGHYRGAGILMQM